MLLVVVKNGGHCSSCLIDWDASKTLKARFGVSPEEAGTAMVSLLDNSLYVWVSWSNSIVLQRSSIIICYNVMHVLKVKRAYHTERRHENGNYCICHLNVSKWVGKRFFHSFANMPWQSNATTYCDVRSSNEFKHPFGITSGNWLMQYSFGEQIFISIASPKWNV